MTGDRDMRPTRGLDDTPLMLAREDRPLSWAGEHESINIRSDAGGVLHCSTTCAVMSVLSQLDLSGWIGAYGYWAVLLLVGLESMGLPLPGETTLIAAAVYAGTSHQ